jgi:DNA-directed RNA polymerase subunit omega
MKAVNKDVEPGEEPLVQSRYSIVIAAAKRARQLVTGDDALVNAPMGKKPLSVAIDELYHSKVTIVGDEEFYDGENYGEGGYDGESFESDDGYGAEGGMEAMDAASEVRGAVGGGAVAADKGQQADSGGIADGTGSSDIGAQVAAGDEDSSDDTYGADGADPDDAGAGR